MNEPIIPFPAPSARDWTEDFSHENGNYMNGCVNCELSFIGHKRRSICKVCATKQPADDSMPARVWAELYPDRKDFHLIDAKAQEEWTRMVAITRRLQEERA